MALQSKDHSTPLRRPTPNSARSWNAASEKSRLNSVQVSAAQRSATITVVDLP